MICPQHIPSERPEHFLLFCSLSSSPSHSLQLPDLSHLHLLFLTCIQHLSPFALSYLCCITASQTSVTSFFHSPPTLSTCPFNLGVPDPQSQPSYILQLPEVPLSVRSTLYMSLKRFIAALPLAKVRKCTFPLYFSPTQG